MQTTMCEKIMRGTGTLPRLFLVLFLISGYGLSAYSETIHLNGYPYTDELSATITTAYFLPAAGEKFEIEYMHDRANVPFFEGRHHQKMVFFKGAPDSELVFVLPGLGASGTSNLALNIAGSLRNMGYSVVTLPNPFDWKFVLGASDSTVPGYAERDASELLTFMRTVEKEIKNRFAINPKSYHLVGCSYGALHAAFVARLNEKKAVLPLKKIVMVNPPIDLENGIKALDSLYDMGNRYSQGHKDTIMGTLLHRYQELTKLRFEPDFYDHILDGISLSTRARSWVIGNTFRDNLGAVIYMSEQVLPKGILMTPQTEYQRSARQAEARSFSFHDYMEKVLIPSLPADTQKKGTAAILHDSSLKGAEAWLKANQQAFVIHSADDFLLDAASIAWIEKTFSNREAILSDGGHLGAVWTPEFKHVLQRFLAR